MQPYNLLPPAIAALDQYPWLRVPLAGSLARQTARIRASITAIRNVLGNIDPGRSTVLHQLYEVIQTRDGGIIALQGSAGSGITTLLAYLAATRPYAFWFVDDDYRQGAATLHAQIIALVQLRVPLVAPLATRSSMSLEHLLAEASSQCSATNPLVLLVDGPTCTTQPFDPRPLPLPGRLPPYVFMIYGCLPEATLPFTPDCQLRMTVTDDILQAQTRLLQAYTCPSEWVAPVVNAAQGNFLYLRLATALLAQNRIDPQALQPGLDFLYDHWWAGLDASGRRLALLLAAAGEPLPADLCRTLVGADLHPWLDKQTHWISVSNNIEQPLPEEEPAAARQPACPVLLSLYHWATRAYLVQRHAPALCQAHADIVALSPLGADDRLRTAHRRPVETTDYMRRQAARHAALGTAETQTRILPGVTQREWIRIHERSSGNLADAATDLAWELHIAVAGDSLLRLARSVALAGTLASRGRSMAPDTALSALMAALEHIGRETALKRVLALVDQLPDGHEKALVLRHLGEFCYNNRMRASAMRLLSQALDLEEQTLPRTWHEQRMQLLAELSQAALNLNAVEAALAISARIGHVERRGMAETRIVRWLLAQNELERAEAVARNIAHESLGAWAQAEVAVVLARSGDRTAGDALLAQVPIETAAAWAQIELACDDAIRDEDAARSRIARLRSPTQRDRGWAQLAHALALADKDGDALEVAGQIADVAVRVTALLDLRLTLEGLVAMLALEQATTAIDNLNNHDARVPLIAALAAAHAAIGHHERAIRIANQLPANEERDRALSRVAVALAQNGDQQQALALAAELSDDDERDWTLDELTRILARSGQWTEAYQLGQKICADELRAHTLADLVIARARADDPLAALQQAQQIALPNERIRALLILAPILVARGYSTVALAIADHAPHAILSHEPPPRLGRGPNLPPDHVGEDGPAPTDTAMLPPAAISRYLAAVTTALAEHGDLAQAQQIAEKITHPLDQARAYLSIARISVTSDPIRSRAALGIACTAATLGRSEAFRILEQATPVLGILGGAEVLTSLAAAIDEIDAEYP